jgi:hypothetical protein
LPGEGTPTQPSDKAVGYKRHAPEKPAADAEQCSFGAIVLTPAQPFQGQNYFQLEGIWCAINQSVVLLGNGSDNLAFMLYTDEQATYLLDLTVDLAPAMGDWQYFVGNGGGSLTPQQGHLLYPFIAKASIWIVFCPAADGLAHQWMGAELTKVC